MGDVFEYPGREVTVTWDKRLCIHVGECTRARNEVFESGRDPWGDPDRASADEVAEVVARCPSGALAIRDAAPEAATQNVIVVSNEGPLYVRGDLRIEGAGDDMPGVRTRAALCRCGMSRRKPFCDGTHTRSKFDDRGAIGRSTDASGEPAPPGPLTVEPTQDGPNHVTGPVTLVTGAGRVAARADDLWLCRCGHSASKPFCDGSHRRVGFRSG